MNKRNTASKEHQDSVREINLKIKQENRRKRVMGAKQRLQKIAAPIIQETGEGIDFRIVKPRQPLEGRTYGFHKVPIHPSNTILIRPKNIEHQMPLVKHFRNIQNNELGKFVQGSVQQYIPLRHVSDLSSPFGGRLKDYADVSKGINQELRKGDILMRRVGGDPSKGKGYGQVGDTFYITKDSPKGELFKYESKYKRSGSAHSLGKKPAFAKLEKRLQKIAERYRAFTNTSSFVGNMRYDQDEQSMTGILSGKHYKWCGVPEKTFDSFQGAASPGAFFNRQIKGQFDCSSGGKLTDIQSRLSKLQKTAGIFGPDPADPNYAIDTADYDTQRKMADIEYPLVRKFKNYRENKFVPTTTVIDGGTYDAIKDQMPNIPASRVTGTSPTGESELDMKIRKETDMLDFVPGQRSEEEVDRKIKVMSRGPFDTKYLHPDPDDVDVDTEVEWNLDEYAKGEPLSEKTNTTFHDRTMQSIYSLLEKAETEYDPRAREQAKTKLMRYMPLGDNNPDDVLDYILENGIEDLGSSNIFGISLKNADRYAKLKARLAAIEPLIIKKKKPKVIKKINVKKGMIKSAIRRTIIDTINVDFLDHPLRKHQEGGFTYNPIDKEFLDASDREQALKIRKVFNADKSKPFGIASITNTEKGKKPVLDPVQILGDTKYLEQKGTFPIWGGYKGSYEVGFGIKGSHRDIIQNTPSTQESALAIDPDGTAYLLYKETGIREKITKEKGHIQTARMLSADAIINEFKKSNLDIKGKSGVFDPVEKRLLDARIPLDAIRLQRFFESGQNSIGFNSITDTRQGPMEDIEVVRSQLKQIEQSGGVPALGFDEGSLEALNVKIGNENEIMVDLLENQRSTGILSPNVEFRILNNPKFKELE